MDKAAYIERLEAAILNSSQAMAILREENATLQELNKQLQQRNTVLEAERSDGSNPNQPKKSTFHSSRNKRSYGGGLKKNPAAAPSIPDIEVEESVQLKRKVASSSLSISHSKSDLFEKSRSVRIKQEQEQEQKQKQEYGHGCGHGHSGENITSEELAVADAFDLDFDDLSSSASDSEVDTNRNDANVKVEYNDHSDEIYDEDQSGRSESDSDSDPDELYDGSGRETVSTAFMEEDEEGDEDDNKEHNIEKSDDSKEDGTPLAVHNNGKEGVKGHGRIDVSSLDHSNLQILYILEHLTMDNVHTASLLLCKYSVVPVCEILCKHIKTVGKVEFDLLRIAEEEGSPLQSEDGATWHNTEDKKYQDYASNTLSPACTDLLERIMALLTSIAARVVSNGPHLCRQILYMMHDNIWLCWFPKDSQTNTAGWKRQGIFELQNSVFFGKCCGLDGAHRGDGSSDVICELFSTILINLAFQQNLFALVEAVLRSYVYVSQHMFSLGTSVGVLNALLLNGNISFSYITMNTTKGFQSNGLVNDLLLKWNSYNTCIIAETILKTIKLHAEEALAMQKRRFKLEHAKLFYEYCRTAAASTREDILIRFSTDAAIHDDGDSPSSFNNENNGVCHYMEYIQSSYSSHWGVGDCGITTSISKNDISPTHCRLRNVLSKWKNGIEHISTPYLDRPPSQSLKLSDKRFTTDMFQGTRMKSAGLWNRIYDIEKTEELLNSAEKRVKCENMRGSASMFQLMGISNVETVVSNLLYVHTHIDDISQTTEEGVYVKKSVWYDEVFGELLQPCANVYYTPKRLFGSSSKASRSVPATLPGVEEFTIQTICSNWTMQLDGLVQVIRSDVSGSECNKQELDIIQRLHFVANTLKNGTIPLYFETAASLKKTNYAYLIQDNIARCKMLLSQQHISLPVSIHEFELTSSADIFSSIEMFQAISIPPVLMKNSLVMLNHCIKQLSGDVENRNQVFLECVSELASNLTHTIYEMLVFMTISSLRALLRACQKSFMHTDSMQHEDISFFQKNSINRSLTRISQECIMILLNMHHTSYYSFNKSYILFDISQTVRYFGVDGAVPNRAKQTATVAEYPDQIHKTLPLPISKWLWEQTFRKIPAFVINLDVRETRWTKLLSQCSRHGILPMRVAAVDARKGLYSPTQEGDHNTDASSLIPPEVVTMTWDSTLNATFDSKCFINVATPMTASERACAASHVMTWKLIYEIFAKNSPSASSELSIFLSSLSPSSSFSSSASSSAAANKDIDRGKRNATGSSKKISFKPIPTPHIYENIPKIWLSQPRPQYQKVIMGENERLAQINDVCNMLALRNQSSNFEYYGKGFLILEDDAVIDPHPKLKGKSVHPISKKLIKKDLLRRVKEIEDKIPLDFDICYLGYTGKTFKKTVKKVLVRPQYVWQLHAYLLSPKGAAKLLMNLPVSAPVDNFIAKLIVDNKLEAYAVPVDAQLVKQEGTFSFRKSTSDIVHSSSAR